MKIAAFPSHQIVAATTGTTYGVKKLWNASDDRPIMWLVVTIADIIIAVGVFLLIALYLCQNAPAILARRSHIGCEFALRVLCASTPAFRRVFVSTKKNEALGCCFAFEGYGAFCLLRSLPPIFPNGRIGNALDCPINLLCRFGFTYSNYHK